MNKVTLQGPIWIASDVHLGPATPATAEAFLGFLDAAADEAAALLLPGDIFDAWIGDDVIKVAPPWLATALQALQGTASRIPLYLGRGNRDFLMSDELANALGAKILPDSAILETDFGRVLLSHGDEYCTDDAAYQQFRTMVRNPDWQAQFLAMSIPERMAMAQQARGESQSANQMKSADIMDVNAQAIEQAFRKADVNIMVHGHTHRPDRHVQEIDGRRRERWVLPDWDCDHANPPRGGWLVIDREGLTPYDLDLA